MRPAVDLVRLLPKLGASFAAVVVFLSALGSPGLTLAGDPGGLELALNLPTSIDGTTTPSVSLTVTNNGPVACNVSTAPTAAAIVAVSHDGQQLQPTVIGPAFVPGGLAAPQSKLVSVPPGGSVSVPVIATATTLETLSALPDDDQTALIDAWPIDAGGNYSVQAALVPAAVSGCSLATAASANLSVSPSGDTQLPLVIAGVIGLVLVVGALVGALLWRRRRAVRVAAIVIAVLAAGIGVPRQTEAKIVYPDLSKAGQAALAVCVSEFTAPGGDPAHVYADAVASGRTIDIDDFGTDEAFPDQSRPVIHRGQKYKTGTPADVEVWWHPDYPGGFPNADGGGDDCTRLYHLLKEADDAANGTANFAKCGSTSREEVAAIVAENLFRASYHLPPVTTFNGKPIPTSLAQCPPPKPKGKRKFVLTCGKVPCGSVAGDPHYKTYDGVSYNLQSAGEFVMTRSDDDAFEIQVRTVPTPTRASASVATAAAARMGDAHLMISLGTGAFVSGYGLAVTVDGSPLTGSGEQPVGTAGTVEETDAQDQVVLRWADGSIALASIIAGAGIDLEVSPSDPLRGHLSGLLGDFDGNQANDFQLADGTVLHSPPTFADLHTNFADAWRVTDATSLFTYAPDTDTSTFTDRSFPPEDADQDVADAESSASDICVAMGLDASDPTDLSNCAFDLAVTGQAAFADAAVDLSLPEGDDAVELGSSDGGGHSPTPSAFPSDVDRGTISLGQTVDGAFGATNEREVYQFHADAGSVADFTTTNDCGPLSGEGTPMWYVARASNLDVPISAQLPFCVDIGRYDFTDSDDYAVVLAANGYTLPYEFSWAGVPTSTLRPISLGNEVTGSIDVATQEVTYSFTTTSPDTNVTISSTNSCDDGFVWKITEGDTDSSPGLGALCGTQQAVHLGPPDEYRITISAPDGVTGSYSFRADATP